MSGTRTRRVAMFLCPQRNCSGSSMRLVRLTRPSGIRLRYDVETPQTRHVSWSDPRLRLVRSLYEQQAPDRRLPFAPQTHNVVLMDAETLRPVYDHKYQRRGPRPTTGSHLERPPGRTEDPRPGRAALAHSSRERRRRHAGKGGKTSSEPRQQKPGQKPPEHPIRKRNREEQGPGRPAGLSRRYPADLPRSPGLLCGLQHPPALSVTEPQSRPWTRFTG